MVKKTASIRYIEQETGRGCAPKYSDERLVLENLDNREQGDYSYSYVRITFGSDHSYYVDKHELERALRTVSTDD